MVLTVFSLTTASCVMGNRTDHWIKINNPAAPAIKREAEVGLGKEAHDGRGPGILR